MEKEKQVEELIQEAEELGVPKRDIYPYRDFGASDVAKARLWERVRNAKNAKGKKWYQKPLGQIIISIFVIVIGGLILNWILQNN